MLDKLLNHNFFKSISLIADIATVVGLVTALRFAFLKKDSNVIAFKISLYLHYAIRVCVMIVATFIIGFCSYYIFLLITHNFSSTVPPNYLESTWDLTLLIISFLISSVIFLGLIWTIGGVIMFSSMNNFKTLINLFFKNTYEISQIKLLEILPSFYGSEEKSIDISRQLILMVDDNKLVIKASNDLAGDPHCGVPKFLNLNYKYNNHVYSVKVKEGETISIPNNNS